MCAHIGLMTSIAIDTSGTGKWILLLILCPAIKRATIRWSVLSSWSVRTITKTGREERVGVRRVGPEKENLSFFPGSRAPGPGHPPPSFSIVPTDKEPEMIKRKAYDNWNLLNSNWYYQPGEMTQYSLTLSWDLRCAKFPDKAEKWNF